MAIFGSSKGRGHGESPRVYLVAFAAAAIAVCLGGAVAIAAVTRGASATQSLSLMAGFVLWGVLAAVGIVVLDGRRHRPAVGTLTRSDRREMRRSRRELRRSTLCSADTLLAEDLSERYGVPVERVAWHVWRIDGELVEATLDAASGQLMIGGRELQL